MAVEIIPPKLTQYQKDIIFSPARFTITEASTKAGKTYSHMAWIFGKFNEYESAINHQYWWIAPVYSQTKIAYKRFKTNLIRTGLYKFNDSELKILNKSNLAEMHFKSAEKVDNLYGENVYAAVMDEAPRMRPEVWAAIRSTLTSTKGPCKLIGNFGGISNWVHKLKDKALTDDTYEYFRITCWDGIDAGILDLDEVMQAQKDLPQKVFEELYEAKASEAEGQLINIVAFKTLFSSNIRNPGATRYITIDPARLGKDSTVVMVWEGLDVIRIIEYENIKSDKLAEVIKALMKEYEVTKANTIIDENGLGAPIMDFVGCKGFLNNGKPLRDGTDIKYANLKAQCYFKLADNINSGYISIDCSEKHERLLTEELEWVRMPKEIDTAKLNILSKDEVKKWLGRSPDYSDAFMMRMIYELGSTGKYARPMRKKAVSIGW